MDNNTATFTPPSTEYLVIYYVAQSATHQGKNSQISMENMHDGTFEVVDGRVSITIGAHKPKRYRVAIEEWDDFYANKCRTFTSGRGHMEVYTEKTKRIAVDKKVVVANPNGYLPEKDKDTQKWVNMIVGAATQAMEMSFTIKAEEVTAEMLKRGAKKITRLSDIYAAYEAEVLVDKELDRKRAQFYIKAFNDALMDFYVTIPRRIDRLDDILAKKCEDFADLYQEQQDMYDLAASQSTAVLPDHKQAGMTWTETHGITVRRPNADEEDYILRKLKHNSKNYVQSWIIDNKHTRAAFDKFCERNKLTHENKGITRLWHGTKVMNLDSILRNGLVIDPERFGASICGKAYGYGTYFAPDAQKSLGYTSIQGSKWANGTNSTGLLLLYDVAVGAPSTQYKGDKGIDHSLSWNNLQKIKPGAFCTWAECRYSGFMMDEVIVYQDCQDTVWAMVEVSR